MIEFYDMRNMVYVKAEELVALAKIKGLRLAAAESCTGGLVAAALTDIAGSSAVFERGFVTYSNDSKIEMLGVTPQTLAAHGAVSAQTAREMALGALARSPADWALAVTGIAGPGGGTPEKPVGTVCFAWAQRAGEGGDAFLGECTTQTRRFAGDRTAVRAQTVAHALGGLLARTPHRLA